MENYIYEKLLGEGSFGSVSLYKCAKTNKKYAIKQIIDISKHRKMISREHKILTDLKDFSNIVNIKECFYSNNNFNIVMEYCEDGTLDEYLENNPNFPKQLKIFFIHDLLRALIKLHRKNIIHRDIKPANCLIKNGVLKLADFGGSIEYQKNTDLTSCGTPLYSAPEIFKTSQYNSKIDVWSFGVVCYEILSGSHPFPAKDYNELQEMIEKNPDYSMFTKNEKDFLEMAIKPNPNSRSSLRELANSKFIREYLDKVFGNLEEIYEDIIENESDSDQYLKLGFCVYFLSEILYLKDLTRFKSDIDKIKLALGLKGFNRETHIEICKALTRYSTQINRISPKKSSFVSFVHKKLVIMPNIGLNF